MFSTDFIFRQQENLVDNQKCWAGFRPLCNKILLYYIFLYKFVQRQADISDKEIIATLERIPFNRAVVTVCFYVLHNRVILSL